MATDNETVEEIVREMRGEVEWKRGKVLLSNVATEFADRLEAAHKREIAAKDREIAVLRECLKEAVDGHCGKGKCEECFFCEADKRKECIAYKWREALKGTK